MEFPLHNPAGRRARWLSCVLALLALAMPLRARIVTDELGRKVTVPDHPQRIISLLPSITDDLFALGAGPQIVAVCDYSNYPAEAKSKRRIGAPLSPSIETIVTLHPDVVLADANLNSAETLNQLEKARVPVFFIRPQGVEGIFHSIGNLGTVLGREQQARELTNRLRARLAAIRQRSQGKPPVRLLMPIWHNPVTTIGARSYLTEMIQIAGGASVTADLPGEWPQVSLEALVVRAPEALLLVRGSKMSMDQIRSQPGWQSMPAVRNNRIYFTDERLELPSPTAFDALEELSRQLHP